MNVTFVDDPRVPASGRDDLRGPWQLRFTEFEGRPAGIKLDRAGANG